MVAQLADTITIAEAARRVGLSPTTMRYWIRRGHLETVMTPLGKVVVTESVEEFQRTRAEEAKGIPVR